MANEIDYSYATIVSIFPRVVKEYKPGLNPSEFILPKGSVEKPGLLVITDDVHHLVNPDPLSDAKETHYIKVPLKALECAQSIIMDWVNALICVEDGAQPGVFAVKGNFNNTEEVKKRFAHEIEEYSKVQYRWFRLLADDATNIWAKTRSVQGISDLQREAAQELVKRNSNLSFEWLTAPSVEPAKCPFCKNSINEGALKCVTCGEILNKEAYDKLKASPLGVFATK